MNVVVILHKNSGENNVQLAIEKAYEKLLACLNQFNAAKAAFSDSEDDVFDWGANEKFVFVDCLIGQFVGFWQ